jgi:alkaline phosphatase D
MPRLFSRRDFMATGAIALGSAPFVGVDRVFARQGSEAVFRHGVASGDPLRDRVVLWTRVTPGEPDATVDVEWMIARDARMSRAIARGSARTSAGRDYTVKIDAVGLAAGSTYYYRFAARGARSPVGRTRTLPARPTQRVKLALASCANLPFGFFNVYGRIAARPDLDAVLHLGDYIYEYPNNGYANRPEGDGRPFGRVPRPDREIVSLDDYRQRYAQYREDPDLQAAHRQHPFVAIWDDHESANNAWSGGAENHNPGEGEWAVRRAAATRAWREWMPVREVAGADYRLYRQLPLGDLADLLMLDTRLTGRDQQAAANDVASIERASRQLLGVTQEDWLAENLRDSTAAGKPWQVLGQQVMFAPQVPAGKPATNNDSWEGYRSARVRVFDMATHANVKHLVVLTGDVHSPWAYDLAREPFDTTKYDPRTGRGAIGTEVVVPAVSSPNPITQERIPALLSSRPHLRYVAGQDRGYVLIEITPERLQADWWAVLTIAERSASERFAKGLVTHAARPHFEEVSSPAAILDAPALAPDLL